MKLAPEVQARIDRYEAAFKAANKKPCKVRFSDGRYWMTSSIRSGHQPWKASEIERYAANLERRAQKSVIHADLPGGVG